LFIIYSNIGSVFIKISQTKILLCKLLVRYLVIKPAYVNAALEGNDCNDLSKILGVVKANTIEFSS